MRSLVLVALLAVAVPARADEPIRITITGTIRLRTDGSPAPGATVVATPIAAGSHEEAAITDENGRYVLDVDPGVFDLTVYYSDRTVVLAKALSIRSDLEFGDLTVEDLPSEIGCVFGDGGHHLDTTRPLFGASTGRGWMPIERDRTHRAWIAPIVAADAASAVTSMHGGVRLARAPGVPLAFVEEVDAHTYRVPIGLRGGSGGTADVSLRSGSNEVRGDARLIAGAEHGGAAGGVEALASGPLKSDAAWLAAGAVATSAGDTDGLVHFHYAASWAHQLEVAALAQAHADATRDGWAHARWVSRLDDAKLELRALATAEYLELPGATAALGSLAGPEVDNRAGGEVSVLRRTKLAGYHRLEVAAGGGTGARGAARATDASVAAGDTWDLYPNFQVEAGVRAETRTLAADRATVIAPRAAVSWDPTKEGRSDVFVAYQRVPHLDDSPDWRDAVALYHDEVAAGVAYERDYETPVLVGVIARARSGGEYGVEGWLHYQTKRTALRAAATTLGRVASVLAQRTLVDGAHHLLIAAASLRASPDATSVGGAITWRHRGAREDHGRDLDTDVSLEGFHGGDGAAARVVLGIAW